MTKTALLSSYDKDKSLLRLAQFLTKRGWKLLGSAGTAKYLDENDIPCGDITEIVGSPILGHKVVTLSREIHAALLASTEKDFQELKRLGIEPIDLVYVALYPLEEALADPAATEQEILEKTDIGGPTLLRSAAKGRRIVLYSPEQLDEFEKRLTSNEIDETYRMALAAAAERRVADYVDTSAKYWENKISKQ